MAEYLDRTQLATLEEKRIASWDNYFGNVLLKVLTKKQKQGKKIRGGVRKGPALKTMKGKSVHKGAKRCKVRTTDLGVNMPSKHRDAQVPRHWVEDLFHIKASFDLDYSEFLEWGMKEECMNNYSTNVCCPQKSNLLNEQEDKLQKLHSTKDFIERKLGKLRINMLQAMRVMKQIVLEHADEVDSESTRLKKKFVSLQEETTENNLNVQDFEDLVERKLQSNIMLHMMYHNEYHPSIAKEYKCIDLCFKLPSALDLCVMYYKCLSSLVHYITNCALPEFNDIRLCRKKLECLQKKANYHGLSILEVESLLPKPCASVKYIIRAHRDDISAVKEKMTCLEGFLNKDVFFKFYVEYHMCLGYILNSSDICSEMEWKCVLDELLTPSQEDSDRTGYRKDLMQKLQRKKYKNGLTLKDIDYLAYEKMQVNIKSVIWDNILASSEELDNHIIYTIEQIKPIIGDESIFKDCLQYYWCFGKLLKLQLE